MSLLASKRALTTPTRQLRIYFAKTLALLLPCFNQIKLNAEGKTRGCVAARPTSQCPTDVLPRQIEVRNRLLGEFNHALERLAPAQATLLFADNLREKAAFPHGGELEETVAVMRVLEAATSR